MAACVSVCVLQSSPALVLSSGTYDITAGTDCPNTFQTAISPLNVTLMSEKAYFILVSGQPPHAKLVSVYSLFLKVKVKVWTLAIAPLT